MKRYTITGSDPFGRDLVIADEDGNQIEGVIEFTLRAYKNEPMRLELEVIPQSLNLSVVSNEVSFRCPHCDTMVNHECEPSTMGGDLIIDGRT